MIVEQLLSRMKDDRDKARQRARAAAVQAARKGGRDMQVATTKRAAGGRRVAMITDVQPTDTGAVLKVSAKGVPVRAVAAGLNPRWRDAFTDSLARQWKQADDVEPQ